MTYAIKVTDAEVGERLAAIQWAEGSLAHLTPSGVSLVDELIADRHAEACAEDREPVTDTRRARGTN